MKVLLVKLAQFAPAGELLRCPFVVKTYILFIHISLDYSTLDYYIDILPVTNFC